MVQTFLISPNKALLDEIYASPAFDPAPKPVLIGTPIELADGRLCVAHPWDEVVTDWLTGYVAGIAGAEVIEAETLPYAVKEVLI